jgi:osmotically-inducible protein OsmY
MSDRSLANAVMQALADNPLVHADEIAVDDRGGDIVLRGTVGSLVQRAEAARTTRAVPGVQNVEDEMRERPLGTEGRADADTEAAVLAAFIDDDELHASLVEVEARDGTVTLRGLVELEWQRDRAERIALEVGGVSRVVNRLRVGLKLSADDVAQRVNDAIGAGAIVGADEVTVSVVDNDVTLTGTVASREHREAVIAAAAATPGVAHVHDALVVRTDPS